MYGNTALTLQTIAHFDEDRKAADRFRQALSRGESGKLWARLLGRSWRLQSLLQARDTEMSAAGYYAGVKSVPLLRIVGSEGRTDDFDRHFRPLRSESRDRWMSILSAMSTGVPLPPVQLLQIGDSYFVRDGHHRISVARALGQAEIDAQVTVVG